MLIGIPRETRTGETRVAATPETVKKLAASGKHDLVVESGAGTSSSIPDDLFVAAGARIGSAAEALGADIVLKVRGPAADELAQMKRGALLVGLLNPFDAAAVDHLRQRGGHGLRAGVAAADLARAGDGRAVVAGQHRRLQGGDARRQRIRPLHADADDRRRHRQGRARAGDGRRCRRPAGDRHGQATGRGDRGFRRAAVGEGPGRIARRQVDGRPLRQRRGAADRRGCGRLRAADAAGMDGAAGRHRPRALQADGHRDHHRADSRAARRPS